MAKSATSFLLRPLADRPEPAFLLAAGFQSAVLLRRIEERASLVSDNRRPLFAGPGTAMTKTRAPLSIDAALARIAGQFPAGWADMATVVDRHEGTVRRWGDQDKPEAIPLPCAIALDIAYQRAGGDGRPLFETYALQLQVAREQAFASEIELARRACILIREGAQAQEAMVLASLPSASERDRAHAVRELEDVARCVTSAIALLTSRLEAPPEPPG